MKNRAKTQASQQRAIEKKRSEKARQPIILLDLLCSTIIDSCEFPALCIVSALLFVVLLLPIRSSTVGSNSSSLTILTMKFSSITALLLTVVSPGVAQNGTIQLHGSGTTNPSKCYWHIMDQFQDRIKLPVKMTYRAVGSSTGQAEFIGDGVSSDNDFGSGDIPFSAEDYASFPAGSVVHFPFVLGAISFFHSVPVEGDSGLELNACLLGKIFNRKITDWTDPEILEVNPNLNLPSPYPIHVARRVQGSSSTASITQYLHATCPEEWPESLVGKTVDWPTDTEPCEGSGGMTNCIRDTPGTIGYIDSGHGHSEGLTEIELLNKDGVYISSKESNERGGIMAATDNAGLPSDLTGSFADVQLLNQVSVVSFVPWVSSQHGLGTVFLTFRFPSIIHLLTMCYSLVHTLGQLLL